MLAAFRKLRDAMQKNMRQDYISLRKATLLKS